MADDALPEEWIILRNWLSEDLSASAKRCGFVRRSTGRVDAEMWLRLILMHVVGGLSLQQTMLRAAELKWCELSHVALFKRLRVAQEWLAELCDGLLGCAQFVRVGWRPKKPARRRAKQPQRAGMRFSPRHWNTPSTSWFFARLTGARCPWRRRSICIGGDGR